MKADRGERATDAWGDPVLTAIEFQRLSPEAKGYVVYMKGARQDQPHVPRTWRPRTAKTAEAYHRGQQRAVIATIDVEG